MLRSILISTALIALTACSSIQQTTNEPSGKANDEKLDQTINISAKRFEFSPNTIKVKEGERIKLTIENTDAIHGIVIPELKTRGNNELIFTAPQKGSYEFRCANFCGKDHMNMSGTIIVE